jgi:hypothetical protein
MNGSLCLLLELATSCNACLILFGTTIFSLVLFLFISIHVHYAYHLSTLINHVMWRTRAESTTRCCKAGLLHKVILMDEPEDGQTEQVLKQKLIAKWTSDNKH